MRRKYDGCALRPHRTTLILLLAALAANYLHAQLPPTTVKRIDDVVKQALADTRTPSASVSIVKGGKLAYANAYGNARLEPPYLRVGRCAIRSVPSASSSWRAPTSSS